MAIVGMAMVISAGIPITSLQMKLEREFAREFINNIYF